MWRRGGIGETKEAKRRHRRDENWRKKSKKIGKIGLGLEGEGRSGSEVGMVGRTEGKEAWEEGGGGGSRKERKREEEGV